MIIRNIFSTIYLYLSKHKVLFFSILIAIFAGILFLVSQIRLEEDIIRILPKTNKAEHANYVFQNLNSSDKIIVKIESANSSEFDNTDELIHRAELLSDSLQPLVNQNLIKEVFYKIDPSQMMEVMNFLFDNIPYFMEEEDYQRLDTLLSREAISHTLSENKKMLTSPMGMIYRDALLKDPLHLSNSILKQINGFRLENQYKTYDGYIFDKDMKCLLMFITPTNPSTETSLNKELIKKLDKIILKVSDSSLKMNPDDHHSEVNISYFGSVAVAVSNAQQIKKDSFLSIAIALILIILILFFYFKDYRLILLLLLPVVFGGLFALAALFLIKGAISAIALGTGSIILGIAINYSLHFLIHYKEELSVEKTLKEIAFPLLVGSITTITAFGTLLFLNSELLEDFGLFAAFTLIGTLIFTLIFLPQLIPHNSNPISNIRNNSIWSKIANYSFENNFYVIAIIFVLSIIFSFFSNKVKFEDDFSKINYMTKEQRSALKELSGATNLSQKLTYFANTAPDLDQAIDLFEDSKSELDSLQSSGIIKSYSGIGHLLPSINMQKNKIERWNQFWENRKKSTQEIILEEGEKLGFTDNSFSSFTELLDKDFKVEPKTYFSTLTNSFLKEYIIDKEGKAAVVTMIYSSPENSNLISEKLENTNSGFCFDTTTLTKTLLSDLTANFNYMLWICGFIVLLFLIISFGRIEISLISFFPMCIAFIWILGIMGIFDIHFNIINIILATFIFGIGDDYSIFIMEGLIFEYTYRKKMLKTYKTAVILSAITLFIGIGSLIFAKHPAMFSLAQVTIIGMISVVVIAYTVAPFIFKLVTQKKGKFRLMPITFVNFTKSFISFSVFFIGSIIITLLGICIMPFGFKSKKNKQIFHQCIFFIFKFLSKIIPQVSCNIINDKDEKFEKPSIIISNHQSHLDLLYLLMLSPKILALTNERVWKSPFYGWILRFADYIPISNGIEDNVDKISKFINDGYSVLIFPEGTRSENCSILRFHQGAFYLAEQLKLDILPILVHGIGHTLPKTEFMLRKGSVTIKIMDRIRPNNVELRQFDTVYKISNAVRNYYKIEYQKLVDKLETPEYFQDLVLHNYVYKGVEIELKARKNLKKIKKLEALLYSLPEKSKILLRNCGQGEFSLLAALSRKNINFYASDDSADNIEIAKNCISIPSNLHYIENDTYIDDYALTIDLKSLMI